MKKSSTPQDALLLLDTTTAVGTGAVVWAKTGLAYIDCAGLGHLLLQVAGTFNVTSQFQTSNDLTTWVSAPMQNVASVPLAENTSVTGVGQVTYDIPVRGWRYFRVNISAYTSGTWAATLTGRAGSATPSTQPVWAGQDGTWNVGLTALAPNGATNVTGASGNVANASAAATLPGVAAKTTYITGFQITAGGATVGGLVTVTVTGVITGTLSYTFEAPTGATIGATPLIVTFPTPIPASAVNTAIVVTLPALGAGNTNATVVAQGYSI